MTNNCCSKLQNLLENITAEPALFLYMFSFALHNTVINNLWLQKICKFQLGVANDACATGNYTNPDKDRIVEINATYATLSNIILMVPASISAAFLGSWCDKYVRK